MNIYTDLSYFFGLTPEFVDNMTIGECKYYFNKLSEYEKEYNIVASKANPTKDKTITITPENADKLAELAKYYQYPLERIKKERQNTSRG